MRERTTTKLSNYSVYYPVSGPVRINQGKVSGVTVFIRLAATTCHKAQHFLKAFSSSLLVLARPSSQPCML